MEPLTVAVVVAGLLVGSVLVLRTPRLPAAVDRDVGAGAGAGVGSGMGPALGSGGGYVVVIPARDEADVLPALLDDLAAQTVPARRVVVVDDGSTDGTGALAAARPGVEVRTARPTPSGWNPKTWALHQGVDDAGEAVVVFLDADVRLAPDALAAVLAARHRFGGLVSVAPHHDTRSAVEALSLPFNLVAVMGAGAGLTARRPSARAAFGPCLAMARDQYAAVGGHAADRGDLLDDIALARRARAAGVPVSLFRGGDRVRYRMYRHGARQILDGWTKNIAAGARRTPVGAGLGVALWVTALLVPLVAAVGTRSWSHGAWALLLWAVVAAHVGWLATTVARFPRGLAALAPLLGVVFVVVAGRSALSLLLGRPVRWKGRRLVQAGGEVTGG